MRMSQLMGKTHRDQLRSTDSASHSLLLRAGYIRQHAAGIYTYLHLGLRSLRKIEAIVREEMDGTGAQEILMSVVHSADVWKQTGRYDEVDATLLRFVDRRGRAMVLGMTHEEIVAQLAATEIKSYRDAGIVVYQIQTKFRDELRSRGGLLRTREFLMKDAYSLHLDEAGLREAYQGQADAYRRIFNRLGLLDVRMIRSDTGLMGGKAAHEFTCVTEAGEDTIAWCRDCGRASNADLVDRENGRCECGAKLEFQRGVEVGNIFQLGTRYTDALGVKVVGRDGGRHSLVMGSYGIGISRLLATLIEQHHDERGIALTAAAAAFDGHIVTLGGGAEQEARAQQVYDRCRRGGLAVLWDDRDAQAGEQLADADLIGATVRMTVGRRAVEEDVVELVERRTGKQHIVSSGEVAEALERLVEDIRGREEADAARSGLQR
jgi:prolyl-tRNA synthetase